MEPGDLTMPTGMLGTRKHKWMLVDFLIWVHQDGVFHNVGSPELNIKLKAVMGGM